MSLAPGASRVVSRMYGGFSNVREDLRIRLGMRDTPGQRALQVAYGETPSVFVINDFGSNIEPVLIEDVLYGTLVEDYTQGSSPVYYRR